MRNTKHVLTATRSSLYLCRESKRDRLIPSLSHTFCYCCRVYTWQGVLHSFFDLFLNWWWFLRTFLLHQRKNRKQQEPFFVVHWLRKIWHSRQVSSSSDSGNNCNERREKENKQKNHPSLSLIIFIIVLIADHLYRLQTASQFGLPFLSTPDNCCHRENLLWSPDSSSSTQLSSSPVIIKWGDESIFFIRNESLGDNVRDEEKEKKEHEYQSPNKGRSNQIKPIQETSRETELRTGYACFSSSLRSVRFVKTG